MQGIIDISSRSASLNGSTSLSNETNLSLLRHFQTESWRGTGSCIGTGHCGIKNRKGSFSSPLNLTLGSDIYINEENHWQTN